MGIDAPHLSWWDGGAWLVISSSKLKEMVRRSSGSELGWRTRPSAELKGAHSKSGESFFESGTARLPCQAYVLRAFNLGRSRPERSLPQAHETAGVTLRRLAAGVEPTVPIPRRWPPGERPAAGPSPLPSRSWSWLQPSSPSG